MQIQYLDFKKAFDSVTHKCHLLKPSAFGIDGNIEAWNKEFQLGRKQGVIVFSVPSDWTDVLSGIHQSSVLVPALFILFLNNLAEIVISDFPK